jgi:hypothetical protein
MELLLRELPGRARRKNYDADAIEHRGFWRQQSLVPDQRLA